MSESSCSEPQPMFFIKIFSSQNLYFGLISKLLKACEKQDLQTKNVDKAS